MEDNFGPGAARLCALAARLLGWLPDAFWQTTPAELATVLAPPSPPQPGFTLHDLHRLMEHDHE